MIMSGPALTDALYYLRNFRQAIQWVVERNDDLLSPAERQFAADLNSLPIAAQALLARLSMRRGDLFRQSKIRYAEIDPLADAVQALAEMGWLDPRPVLALQEVFRLSTRAELGMRFGERIGRMNKQDAYDALVAEQGADRPFQDWLNTNEAVYHVSIAPLVLQFRLLHFGNFYQEWHEYTLAYLQVFKYEPVPLDLASRPFQSREDIEFFYALYRCYEVMGEGAKLPEALEILPNAPPAQDWLRRRWDRLRYHLGQIAEREEDPRAALLMYRDNTQPDARIRQVRVLERLERDEEALVTARALIEERSSELIVQRATRIVARIERRQGIKPMKRAAQAAWVSTRLRLSPDPERRVEMLVQEHLSRIDAPVHYVENSLICSLFGLLCWEAIFLPVRGAFFHPFQSGPADLGCPEFVARRRSTFNLCLQHLETGEHATIILRTFTEKYGTSAPFVHWFALDEPLLQLALTCIPAEHLKLYFARLLDDLSENATGFPDLVQFFPATLTYKLIEVKGPGDRPQDNQRRWLSYFASQQLPVEVCQVTWA
ncbi:VRR-NUC domain-containing protein [Steroidobacter agaridevorans]|uniref:VRR-NUC domain-containing protein n=1 Tax=Steroidobacter agaridevorans TaxID=2695856 RepID=UPI001327A134|nr:VRR-NUC domain-containing protein [Steroidobacter agaridevorans]GFE87769.1 hypothetical protein GCM10011488_27230 [Steroidobacter agaridevorans]